MSDGTEKKGAKNAKDEALDASRRERGERMSNDQGVLVADDRNSLKAGVRGPTLMEDFFFREKMTHFDHERIPERVVHARGSAAHGYFQVYDSLADLTKAAFLGDPSKKTPVFVRFSTVVGFRGSADTVRDVRGFATKFYTEDGNFDLVGNNMPIFFIQDAMQFPDLVHSIKPEPHHEMPQASAAHDTFWDFISLMPESMHMILWVLSDRALPRSYATMEGFGVHTFRLVNAAGESHFVKFHWKPVAGMASMVWDEYQKVAGKDPDFHRRDLWERIESGHYPEFELGLQIVEEKDEHAFDFDLLDPTKIIPEEVVPVRRVGKMVLDRNPDNFFAETEQVAFHPGHIVPGLDFTNDPLLQGRLFSYLDTQLLRLGGPNFAEIPINRPIAPVHNHQRDGFMRQTIDKGRASYEPNSLGGGCPMHSPENLRAFTSYAAKLEGSKVRERSPSFSDHYSQATLFWNSLSPIEQDHLVEAAEFELGKVETIPIRERMLEHLHRVDASLGARVGEKLGLPAPSIRATPNHGRSSPALRIETGAEHPLQGRKVAVLAADGVEAAHLSQLVEALEKQGAMAKIVAPRGGELRASDGSAVAVDKTYVTTGSILFDAVFVPGGAGVTALMQKGDAVHFVREAFRHGKPVAAVGEGVDLLALAALPDVELADAKSKDDVRESMGVVTLRRPGSAGGVAAKVGSVVGVGPDARLGDFVERFLSSMTAHRHWSRTRKDEVPA